MELTPADLENIVERTQLTESASRIAKLVKWATSTGTQRIAQKQDAIEAAVSSTHRLAHKILEWQLELRGE